MPESERLSYPGLFPAEVPVLRAWLKAHESEYDSFEYNVRVGSGSDPGPTYPPYIRLAAMLNTQFRIDLVTRQGDTWTLIEVKQHAGASALGQLLTYRQLWQEAFPTRGTPRLLVVTADPQPDVPRVLAANGVALEVVTPAPA